MSPHYNLILCFIVQLFILEKHREKLIPLSYFNNQLPSSAVYFDSAGLKFKKKIIGGHSVSNVDRTTFKHSIPFLLCRSCQCKQHYYNQELCTHVKLKAQKIRIITEYHHFVSLSPNNKLPIRTI